MLICLTIFLPQPLTIRVSDMWPFSKKPKQIQAVIPKEPVVLRFMPKETFECKKMRSTYIASQVYYLRDGNDKLEAMLNKWLKDDLVEILED